MEMVGVKAGVHGKQFEFPFGTASMLICYNLLYTVVTMPSCDGRTPMKAEQ